MTEERGAALPDQKGRDRIREDLETNLLVEAGAGAGKTTALLDRMAELIRSGIARVDQVAAVTFTRKAAAELRERFQTRLEAALHEARQQGDPELVHRLDEAVRDIDRGFIGTIHAFCARLLRERPLEAGLDPSFRELFGPEEERLRAEAWHRFLERLTHEEDDVLGELADLHLEPLRLQDAYDIVVNHPDVDFPAPDVDKPDLGALRRDLGAMLDEALAILPEREPEKGWDGLQKRIRELEGARRAGWEDDAPFLDALALLMDRKLRQTLIRWGPHAEEARDIKERLQELKEPGGAADIAVRQWLAHRYPVALAFVRRASREFEEHRIRRGLLTFNDLLMRAAALLRDNPRARRDLGERYRFVLVDEFQDTDPVQAELVFLLTAEDPREADWRAVEPRAGSLFVVGDPKQSIYRFRRADIAVYNQVKKRFRSFGDVVVLTANFRSRPPLERFVNGVFPALLPEEATKHQAAFAPLDVQQDDIENQGVYWYEVPCDRWGMEAVAAADAPLVASWIAQRVASGERKAGDFLVLTYRKQYLSSYATELERHNVPVQVTGSGVDLGDELAELVRLLEALAEPDDPVLTVTALTGRFFGLDLEALVEHRHRDAPSGRRRFRFDQPWDAPETVVERGLARMNGWWRLTRRLPADVAVGRIVDDLGLLPYLAASELGESNAGGLAFALDTVRQAGLNGDSSLQAAVDALQEALASEEVEAPLQPGREDVVRVMNLHKAKGLEAPVVILAHPTGMPDHDVQYFVDRRASGDARGHFVVGHTVGSSWSRRQVRLACPLDWDDLVEREEPYQDAEYYRLLYVATTRAGEELVIARCEGSLDHSPWAPLYSHLDDLADELGIQRRPPPERQRLEVSVREIVGEVDRLAERRRESGRPGYEIQAVSKQVKDDEEIFTRDGGRGSAWGNAVHQSLEAAGRGVGGVQLRRLCRTALLENDLPVEADGEPRDLEDLLKLVRGVRASETLARARQAERALVEVPFALPEGEPRVAIVTEGVIDLAFREDDGWVIVDYKTDEIEDPAALQARLQRYRAQVDRYAECWARITGEPVKERRILLLGMERDDEVW